MSRVTAPSVDTLGLARLRAAGASGPVSVEELPAMLESGRALGLADSQLLDFFTGPSSWPLAPDARELVEAMRTQLNRSVGLGWEVREPDHAAAQRVRPAVERSMEMGVLWATHAGTGPLSAGVLLEALQEGTAVEVSIREMESNGRFGQVRSYPLTSLNELLLLSQRAAPSVAAAEQLAAQNPGDVLRTYLWSDTEWSLASQALGALASDVFFGSTDAGRQFVMLSTGAETAADSLVEKLKSKVGLAEVSRGELTGIAQMLRSPMFGRAGQLVQQAAFVRWATAHPAMLDGAASSLLGEATASLATLPVAARRQLDALVNKLAIEQFSGDAHLRA